MPPKKKRKKEDDSDGSTPTPRPPPPGNGYSELHNTSVISPVASRSRGLRERPQLAGLHQPKLFTASMGQSREQPRDSAAGLASCLLDPCLHPVPTKASVLFLVAPT